MTEKGEVLSGWSEGEVVWLIMVMVMIITMVLVMVMSCGAVGMVYVTVYVFR